MELAWITAVQSAVPASIIPVVIILTEAGGALCAIFAWIILAVRQGRRRALLCASIHAGGMLALIPLLKASIARPRPFLAHDAIVVHIETSSAAMPSGHAYAAMITWGLIYYACPERWIRMCCLGLIALVGLSRIILGVHYPSDVLAGWALGGLTLWIMIYLTDRNYSAT